MVAGLALMGAPPIPPVVLSREDVDPMPMGATAVSPVKPSTTNSPSHALYLHPTHPQKHVYSKFVRKLTDDSGDPYGAIQTTTSHGRHVRKTPSHRRRHLHKM